MQSVTLASGVVHYREYGQGAPLVLLHANPGESRDFEAIIPQLAMHFRVLALDWPGYGASALPAQPEAVGILYFYQVLREFLAALALGPVLIIGNSMGGNVAARLAAQEPAQVRGLVLVAPGGFTTPGVISRWFCRWQGSRLALSPYRFACLYLKQRTATTRAMLERAASSQAAAARLILNHAVWRAFGSPDNDLRAIAPNIKAPTLLMFGQYDPVIRAHKDGKVAARCIMGAQLLVLPCGHAAFAEVPELFLAHVQAFLAGCANA